MLKTLLATKHPLVFIEAHNPISALIVDRTRCEETNGSAREYDGIWSSSLTDSASRGLPDIEVLDIRSRLQNINEIQRVTSKPIIMDCDTGGSVEHFAIHVRAVERAGVAAVIIEDKSNLKRNSLFGNSVKQELASIPEFCAKISRGKAALKTKDFMIIARLESLILGAGIEDAIARANAYVAAGADGIMIHSRMSAPDEVIQCAAEIKKTHPNIPLVCVPTNYFSVSAKELSAAGFDIIIYANHLLRSAYQSMEEVSLSILKYGRTAEIESKCISVSKIINLIPFDGGEAQRVPSLHSSEMI